MEETDKNTKLLEKQDAKSESREIRLRKTNEEVLRRKLQDQSKKHCKEEIHAFGDCSKREGLMVLFRCREAVNAMNACMEKYCNEDEFQKFKANALKNSDTQNK